MNVFNGVTSHRGFSYFFVLPVGLNFKLTYGLKPQVSGIKIVTVYRRSIFQVEWLIATLINDDDASLKTRRSVRSYNRAFKI